MQKDLHGGRRLGQADWGRDMASVSTGLDIGDILRADPPASRAAASVRLQERETAVWPQPAGSLAIAIWASMYLECSGYTGEGVRDLFTCVAEVGAQSVKDIQERNAGPVASRTWLRKIINLLKN
ncbi:hypothetical protein BDK51DRAFT_52653 [Blyttiomyces helicus]|uniref:Uncharacterized protein n=1 Tax=Blyttiomyces helicus TaxID=388810 RepID=A0A4P9W2F8_9FUNG|nr:hypothetical protein BDK51DRAFT_52653 [Blyttiomyces helicus]|eukprot:RKO85353.1 hypothetical protein BDK51DRAFT_52653 [Blyttiomyces helicus]